MGQFLDQRRVRRGAEQDFWGPSVNYYSGSSSPPEGIPFMEIPVNDVHSEDVGLDKIQVVSSALRILPRSKVHSERLLSNSRRRKRETVESWRRPRQHQFVTNALDRLPPPPIVRVYPPVDRSERLYDRGFRKSQRRIIYYANLPEIVRPPSQWYNTRDYSVYDSRQNYPSTSSSSYSPATVYPPLNDNDITRVQSNIIDVSNSRYNSYPSSSSPPKFTIIDVEPPYNYRGYNRHSAVPAHYDPYPPPNRFYDTRTPPYRDYSAYPTQNFRPDSSLEPVKLQLPTTDRPSSTTNTTEYPVNTTRFLPDNIPVSLQALSKFVT